MLEFDESELFKTLSSVEKQAALDDIKIVKENARVVLTGIVDKTQIQTGHGRAGFFPAWKGLGLPGSPKTPASFGTQSVRLWKTVTAGGKTFKFLADVTYFVDGTYKEDFKPGNPAIVFANKTKVHTKAGEIRETIKTIRAEGKGERGEKRRKRQERIKSLREKVKGKSSKFDYLRALNAGTLTDENGDNIGAEHKGFFTKVIQAHKMDFKDHYKKNMERHSK